MRRPIDKDHYFVPTSLPAAPEMADLEAAVVVENKDSLPGPFGNRTVRDAGQSADGYDLTAGWCFAYGRAVRLETNVLFQQKTCPGSRVTTAPIFGTEKTWMSCNTQDCILFSSGRSIHFLPHRSAHSASAVAGPWLTHPVSSTSGVGLNSFN